MATPCIHVPQTVFPTFARVIALERADKSALARLASFWGWTRFGVMYPDDVDGRNTADHWEKVVTDTEGNFPLNKTMPGAARFTPGLTDTTEAGRLALQEDADRMRSIFTMGEILPPLFPGSCNDSTIGKLGPEGKFTRGQRHVHHHRDSLS
jgi:hypothetical protein